MVRWPILSVLPVLMACAAEPAIIVPPIAVANEAPGVRLALLPPSREGNAALAQGTLRAQGPCLHLVGADGTRWTPGFMTFDTRWDGGALFVGGRRFLPGQRVALGGGEVKGAVANMAWVQAPDPTCDSSLIWVTVSIDAA